MSSDAPRTVILSDAGSGACISIISGIVYDAVPAPPLLLKISAVVNGVVEISPANTNVLVSYDALPVPALPTGVAIPNVTGIRVHIVENPNGVSLHKADVKAVGVEEKLSGAVSLVSA